MCCIFSREVPGLRTSLRTGGARPGRPGASCPALLARRPLRHEAELTKPSISEFIELIEHYRMRMDERAIWPRFREWQFSNDASVKLKSKHLRAVRHGMRRLVERDLTHFPPPCTHTFSSGRVITLYPASVGSRPVAPQQCIVNFERSPAFTYPRSVRMLTLA